MNLLNYGSCEACQRLVDVGIVLETEKYWKRKERYHDDVRYILTDNCLEADVLYPAPSMAEVWRELPEFIRSSEDDILYDGTDHLKLSKDGDKTVAGYGEYSEMGINTNPTDALIDLLIWTRKEATDIKTVGGNFADYKEADHLGHSDGEPYDSRIEDR